MFLVHSPRWQLKFATITAVFLFFCKNTVKVKETKYYHLFLNYLVYLKVPLCSASINRCIAQNTKGTGEQNTFQGQENSFAHTRLGAVMRRKRKKERKKET